MRTAQQEIFIARAPEAVFDFMLDFAQAPRWRPFIASMAVVGDGLARAGARIRMTFWVDGREHVQETTLEVCERPTRQVFFTDDAASSFQARFEFSLAPDGDGTRVRIAVDTTARSLGGRLLLPLIRPRHKVRFREMLARLKRAVEE